MGAEGGSGSPLLLLLSHSPINWFSDNCIQGLGWKAVCTATISITQMRDQATSVEASFCCF